VIPLAISSADCATASSTLLWLVAALTGKPAELESRDSTLSIDGQTTCRVGRYRSLRKLWVGRLSGRDMPPNQCESDEHQKHRRTEHDEVGRGSEGKHEGSGGARENCPEAAKRYG